MAKRITALLLCLLMTLFSACGKESVNDSETGAIPLGDKKYQYIDGEYTACADYFDADGNACALALRIQNGIITKVNFEYFDTKYIELSTLTDEANAEKASLFRASRKSLCSQLLADQHIGSIPVYRSETGSDFAALANRALALARSGDEQHDSVYFQRVYKAESELTLSELACTAKLTLNFSGETLSRIVYDIIDENGVSIRENDPLNAAVFEQSGRSISALLKDLNTLPAEDNSPVRTDIAVGEEAIVNAFNTLCEKLIKAHRAVNYEKITLFAD